MYLRMLLSVNGTSSKVLKHGDRELRAVNIFGSSIKSHISTSVLSSWMVFRCIQSLRTLYLIHIRKCSPLFNCDVVPLFEYPHLFPTAATGDVPAPASPAPASTASTRAEAPLIGAIAVALLIAIVRV